MLEIEGLEMSYDKKNILKNINFSLQAGEVVSLLGKNGVGKTTLFKCLLNVLKYEGNIFIEGANIKTLSRNNLAKKMAYIPQNRGNQSEFTVFEMVLMGTTPTLKLYQQPGVIEVEMANEALKMLGILSLKHANYAEISGGEQQLVTIARAVAQQAKIIIMDEPCANLDFGNQILVLDIMKLLASKGYLILQSTHEPNHVLQYANRVLIMNHGEITENGSPKSVLTGKCLSELYDTPIEVIQSNSGQPFCLAKKE